MLQLTIQSLTHSISHSVCLLHVCLLVLVVDWLRIRSLSHLHTHPGNQSVSKPEQSVGYTGSQLVYQSVGKLFLSQASNQPASWTTIHPLKQPATQSVSQSVS